MKAATLFRSAILSISLATISLQGQVITASVNGIVLDPTGAAVPGAKVRAVNTSTNLEVNTTSDPEGRYTIPSLPPGGPLLDHRQRERLQR